MSVQMYIFSVNTDVYIQCKNIDYIFNANTDV